MALRGAVGGQHVVRSATKARRLPDPRSPGALSVVVPLPHCRGPQHTTPNNTQTVERTGVPTAPPPSPQSTTGPGAVEPCDPTSVSASPHTPPPRPSPHTLARAGGGLGIWGLCAVRRALRLGIRVSQVQSCAAGTGAVTVSLDHQKGPQLQPNPTPRPCPDPQNVRTSPMECPAAPLTAPPSPSPRPGH